MSLEIKVPSVGESISEVTVAKWFKNNGDQVEMDEVICELESDKATFEVSAEIAGTLKIIAKDGEVVEIGGSLCLINPSDTVEENKSVTNHEINPSEIAPVSNGKVISMHVPSVGESISEVTISNWSRKSGDQVVLDEVIAEIESDKATFELTAEASGRLEIIANNGDTIEIGALICRIEVGEVKQQPEVVTSEASLNTGADARGYAAGHAAPAAAKILAEKGISAASVIGTGKEGRITKEDAMNAQKSQTKAPQVDALTTPTPVSENTASGHGVREEQRKKMSPLRKTVAKRLVGVKNETAMLTTFNEVNMQPIMDLRQKYKESFKAKYEVGLGFMSFFTKACCMALQEWPAVNAKIDGDEIVYSNFCDISIAVSAPKGLVVPVIRNAEAMSFDQIEKEVVRLAMKARENKLSIPEMTGGTFTITNGGIFGSMLSTPIINAPQSAILGMHNIVERPVVENGQVVVRPIMYLALSYDHRIIDGRESVSFLIRVKQLLEDPSRLLLGI
jgi:2-oxoglutarate dehydrogenase E2 component (dihydrolipoamide succinyltransferase)|tara:strand:+ start:3501 stop:5021 length:1521 start_codon:yes stop_codon:yes gene_type:complete